MGAPFFYNIFNNLNFSTEIFSVDIPSLFHLQILYKNLQ